MVKKKSKKKPPSKSPSPPDNRPLSQSTRDRLIALVNEARQAEQDFKEYKETRKTNASAADEARTEISSAIKDLELTPADLRKKLTGLDSDVARFEAKAEDADTHAKAAKERYKSSITTLFDLVDSVRDGTDLFEQKAEDAAGKAPAPAAE